MWLLSYGVAPNPKKPGAQISMQLMNGTFQITKLRPHQIEPNKWDQLRKKWHYVAVVHSTNSPKKLVLKKRERVCVLVYIAFPSEKNCKYIKLGWPNGPLALERSGISIHSMLRLILAKSFDPLVTQCIALLITIKRVKADYHTAMWDQGSPIKRPKHHQIFRPNIVHKQIPKPTHQISPTLKPHQNLDKYISPTHKATTHILVI